MDITQDITKLFRTRHETKWIQAIQQETELVKPYVTIHANCSGKNIELPGYGTTSMIEYSGRFQQVEWSHIKHFQRWLFNRKFYNAVPLEEDDIADLDTLHFRAAEVIGEQRKALARMRDEVILGVIRDKTTGKWRIRTTADGVCGGILAPNYTGENGTTIAELDFSAGSHNVIPVDYCAKGTKTPAGMLIDKIALLRARYLQLDCFKEGSGEEIVVAISPEQHMDLVLLEQMQNRNYGFSCLLNGEVNSALGVKFFVTNMLPLDEDGNRLCVAWLKSRVKYGAWKEAEFRVEARPDYLGVREQILAKARCGATRLDEDTVFVLPCKETSLTAAA